MIHCGDWLAVIYDKNWWLAKAVIVDTQHQDVKAGNQSENKTHGILCFNPLFNDFSESFKYLNR